MVTDGSAELTKDDAVNSLGKKAARFVVVDWTKQEAAPAEGAAEEEKSEDS